MFQNNTPVGSFGHVVKVHHRWPRACHDDQLMRNCKNEVPLSNNRVTAVYSQFVRFICWWVNCAMFGGWLGLSAVALAADGKRFSIQNWQTDQGLPQNSVTAVFQGQDGYIWLGTYNGLVHFDGVRFVVFNSINSPGLKNSRITSLYQTADKAIWIGHESGDVSCLRDGRFSNSNAPRDWPGEAIVGISQDEQGDVWALNILGMLQRLRDHKVLRLSSRLRNAWVIRPAFSKQSNGQLSVLVSETTALQLRQGELVPDAHGYETGTNQAVRVCGSRDGGQWILSEGRIRKWKQNAWMQDLGPCAWSNVFITTACETHDGSLCVGTLGNGLFILTLGAPALNLNHTNGLPHDWVRCLTEDHEGNLWVGTSGGGLCVLRATKATMHSPPDNWQSRSVLSVAKSQTGDLWAGTEGAGLYHMSAGTWQHYGVESNLPNQFIWSVLEDHAGNLWVGTWGNGLFKREEEKFVRAPGWQKYNVQVTALFEGKDGVIWAGTGAGLLRYQNGRVMQYGRNEGVTILDIRAITQSADGSVWFGTMGGGLGCLRDGHITTFTKHDGLGSDFILSLHLDAADTLWVGTLDNGLSRMKDGRFKNISSANGLANDIIGHIAEDGDGWFWLSSQAGILRVNKTELNRCADGLSESVECLIYGKNQGLSTVACSAGFQPSGVQTGDGHLWIPTAKGLAEVDPKLLEKNIFPPPVRIESADIGGRLTPIENLATATRNGRMAFRTLEIPPDKQRLSVKFTALSYIEPEAVRFRYRLAPLEPGWVEGGTHRAADYSYVPPGEYEFTVIACNNDGVWNHVGDTLRIIVQPHFWQTTSFQLSASVTGILGVAGTVFGLTRQRERRKLERIKQEAALERERTRIALDIHDDLGASLTRMTMLSHTALEESGQHPELSSTLGQLHQTAREITRTMDEIVWAVNPQHDSLESLTNYLGRFAQTFLTTAGIRCRLNLPLDISPLPLNAEMRHNIFLAFKESLNNVVRHSRATEVTIEMQLHGTELHLLIQDNGSGFKVPEAFTKNGDLETATRISSGNGLLSIHRRMEDVGGHCHIESKAGAGTSIELLANLKHHYGNHQ